MGLIRRFGIPRRADRVADADSPADASTRSVVEAVQILVAASRLDEALRAVDAALIPHPDDKQLLFTRGSVLFEWGRLWEARRDLLAAERLGQHDARLDLQLGWVEMWTGHADDATQRMRDVARDSEDWRAHFGLASALTAKGEWHAARRSFERALDLSRANIDCLLSLVSCAVSERKLDEAEAYARRATSEHPTSPAGWTSLGVVLVWQDRFAEATVAFDRAQEIALQEGDAANPVLDAGIPMRDGGKVEDAVAFYRRLLPAHPDLKAHGHYAYALLKAGHLREGWEQNEFRWMFEPLCALVPRIPVPVWTGQDVHGKTVLIMGEQGIGDVIQFIRYAQLLKTRGARVLVLLRKRMREIVEGMSGVDAVFDRDDALPSFDFRVPIMSLPSAFGTTLETIPSPVPYVPVKRERLARWQREIAVDGTLNVGIAWAGDPIGLRNVYKSIPLHLLAPLSRVAGVRFYSLQKGRAAEDALHAPSELRLVDLSPRIQDLADTAAIIDSLDLVITICTSVAHLAGALAKPVWTLLSEPADWRWMEHREDTPWYPTMRLFRQKRQGDWPPVVEEVSQALAVVARDRRQLTIRSRSSSCPISNSLDDRSSSPHIGSICRAAATRHGMMQFRPDGSPASRSIEWYGEYRHRQLTFLGHRIRRGAIVIDVASGSGFDSPLLASAAGATGHVFFLEPRTAHLPLLSNNVNANGISNSTTVPISLQGAFDESTQQRSLQVEAIGLDALCLPRFEILKISECADPVPLLQGAETCLWNFRPTVMLWTIDEATVRAAGECLADFAYQTLRLDCPLFDVDNFNRRPVDVFDGETAFALVALPEELDMESARNEWRRLIG